MTPYTFGSMVIGLCHYYEKREPREETVRLWLEKVARIPDEAADWIRGRITDQSESFPKNLPGMIYALYCEWLEAHPEKKAHENMRECPDCIEGFILAEKGHQETRYPYRYAFRCGKCGQGDNHKGYPRATKRELFNMGYTIFDPRDRENREISQEARAEYLANIKKLQQKFQM